MRKWSEETCSKTGKNLIEENIDKTFPIIIFWKENSHYKEPIYAMINAIYANKPFAHHYLRVAQPNSLSGYPSPFTTQGWKTSKHLDQMYISRPHISPPKPNLHRRISLSLSIVDHYPTPQCPTKQEQSTSKYIPSSNQMLLKETEAQFEWFSGVITTWV